MTSGEWLYSTIHKTPCRILEEKELWGNTTCRIILHGKDTLASVPKSTLKPLTWSNGSSDGVSDSGGPDGSYENNNTETYPGISTYHLRYTALAAKIADVLEGNPDSEGNRTLLAPYDSAVIPLPHQMTALNRVVSGERVRYLLADEVGLGKTIEAGLIMRELKLRGLIKRTLVIAPKGLTEQWEMEMKTHFSEDFSVLLPGDLQTLRKVAPAINSRFAENISKSINSKISDEEFNPWTVFDQAIVPMDSVKPLDSRKGWTKEKIAEYNKERFEDLISAGWDLIVIDESHRLGGSTDLVARYKLGKGLAESSPYLLLLSATPHQGKTDSFFRLISLLDEKMFPDPESITREKVADYVIRTIKRNAIDSKGNPLFRPRNTELYPVRWESHHKEQKALYYAVTEYIRKGYNEAITDKKQYIGFLMVLMQRLVTSSTAAIETTLRRRLEVLEENTLILKNHNISPETKEFYDMDGQDLLDTLPNENITTPDESDKVKELLKLAEECRAKNPDVKAEALTDIIYKLSSEEKDPDLKILIFTEFIPTQDMLYNYLNKRGFTAEVLNGKMTLEERNRAQGNFRKDARFLISTDAGGEGLNLQFCHVVINYDIPWNPMRLEQRIGRVDRIGQTHPVKAINFVFENSIEFRVREVLEEKLAVIYQEFGVDKTGDVLDCTVAGEIFEDLFIETIANPDTIDSSVDEAVSKIQDELKDIKEHSVVNSITNIPDMQLSEETGKSPFSYWLENMTVSYLRSHNGTARQLLDSWELTWPDNTVHKNAVFKDTERNQNFGYLTLSPEEEHISDIIRNIPEFITDGPVPIVHIPELPENVSGFFGLFEISYSYEKEKTETLRFIPEKKKKYLPVFLSEDDINYRQTARFIWDCLISKHYNTHRLSDRKASGEITVKLIREAESAGEETFSELKAAHEAEIQNEKLRAKTSFSARRRAIERIGLPEVKNFRLKKLDEEEKFFETEIKSAELIIPNLKPLLILRIRDN